MSSDKNINLLPEDLRIKEEKTKSPRDFHIDLVVPDSVEKSKSLKPSGFFWQKLKNIFSKKARFEIPQAPKPGKEKKEEEKSSDETFKQKKHSQSGRAEFSEVHLPKDQSKTEERKIHYVKKSGFDFSLPEQKDSSQVKKPSFWSKLKNIFSRKNKPVAKKEVKEEYQAKPLKNGADSILLKGLNGKVDYKQKEKEQIEKDSEIDIEKLSEKKLDDVPSASPPEKKESEPYLPPIKAPLSQAMEKRDFSLPEIDYRSGKEKNSKSKSADNNARFHQPQGNGAGRFVDGGAGLDLIPKSVRTKSWRQIGILTIIALLGSVLIVGFFYVYLFFQEKNIENQQVRRSNQISDLEKSILQYEAINKEISALGNEIRAVHDLLSQHIYWTNFFAMLEKYTPAEVYYQGINAGNKGALTLSAVGRDYDSPARLLKLLQQPEAKEFVSMASISSASLREQGVSFNVTLVLNEDLFYYGFGPKDWPSQ